MNIFEDYKNKLLKIIKKAKKENLIVLPDNLDSVNVDSTPQNIDYDLSTNAAMVLSKSNKKSPEEISKTLLNFIKNEDNFIEQIVFAKPGFINIKFNNIYWNNFAKSLIDNPLSYGSLNKIKKKYLVI